MNCFKQSDANGQFWLTFECPTQQWMSLQDGITSRPKFLDH
jgi:hypothetical protein